MQRAVNAADDIRAHLAAGNYKEAWCVAKGWYRAVEDRVPKPCYRSTEKQTAERVKLYGKVEPLGDPIPINVNYLLTNIKNRRRFWKVVYQIAGKHRSDHCAVIAHFQRGSFEKAGGISEKGGTLPDLPTAGPKNRGRGPF